MCVVHSSCTFILRMHFACLITKFLRCVDACKMVWQRGTQSYQLAGNELQVRLHRPTLLLIQTGLVHEGSIYLQPLSKFAWRSPCSRRRRPLSHRRRLRPDSAKDRTSRPFMLRKRTQVSITKERQSCIITVDASITFTHLYINKLPSLSYIDNCLQV